ncbi:MAG: DUF3823 domain-containing protein [Balneolaceae bacterium]|nr:DUF3823 domain-containing protein [Balneolaceae bacterium]
MKIQYIVWLLPLVLFTACSLNNYDNYDEPESRLQGAFLHEGDSVRVSYDNVTFELWQSGFGAESPINVTVDQNGSYSAVLFDGNYRLVVPPGQGPFIGSGIGEGGSDTLDVELRGDQQLDIEIMPYYMIRNSQFSNSGNTVSANFEVEQIVTGAIAQGVEHVQLYVSKTNYVDTRTSISTNTMLGDDISDMSNINLSTDIPSMTPTQDYVFVRVGVKATAVRGYDLFPSSKDPA